MFNLEKRERSIILFLIITLLAGLAVLSYKRAHSAIDVTIRAFESADAVSGFEKININSADENDLMRLPGVGRSLSCKIIEYRGRSGNFSSVEELKRVKGIKDGLFKKIKDRITVE